ncbi:MAG: hypothetical protein NZ602_00240 [Thermoguttaceae bacterium]|nr:hypothetical protein [Thermoguttaceae bacterium]MDW8039632.1 hypothetical protein [Thermoguttaceae bacterium]
MPTGSAGWGTTRPDQPPLHVERGCCLCPPSTLAILDLALEEPWSNWLFC